MLSALKRCARGYSSGLRVIQGNGVIVERSVMSSISIRSLAGAGTGRAGKAAFELLDEDIEEKFVKVGARMPRVCEGLQHSLCEFCFRESLEEKNVDVAMIDRFRWTTVRRGENAFFVSVVPGHETADRMGFDWKRNNVTAGQSLKAGFPTAAVRDCTVTVCLQKVTESWAS